MRLSELRDFNPRFCFVDTETTSIDTKRAAPIEISIIKDDFSGDWASSQWFLRPHANADIVDEALNVNKVTREELETLPEPHLVFKEFKKCLTEDVNPFKVGKGLKDKFFFVAYNAPFNISSFLISVIYRQL